MLIQLIIEARLPAKQPLLELTTIGEAAKSIALEIVN